MIVVGVVIVVTMSIVVCVKRKREKRGSQDREARVLRERR